MRTRLVPAAVVAACVVVSAGCRGPNGLHPVSGKVLHNGEPAVGATVTFVRKDAVGSTGEQTPQGVGGDDGTFTLAGPAGTKVTFGPLLFAERLTFYNQFGWREIGRKFSVLANAGALRARLAIFGPLHFSDVWRT